MSGHRGRMVVGVLVTVLLASLAPGKPAVAQPTCVPGDIDVRTSAEFNAVVACHNEFGEVNVRLLNDIVAPLQGFTPISGRGTPAGDGSGLLIDGNGFSLIGNSTSTNPVLSLIARPPADGFAPTELFLLNLGIQISGSSSAGILHQGPHRLSLKSVAITATAPTAGTGIVSAADDQGQLVISGSLIRGVATGIELDTDTYIIESSTIDSSDTDIKFTGSGGIGGIFTSTLGGPVGIELSEVVVRVENSTFLGDAAKAGPLANADSAITLQSSIANICSTNELIDPATPGPGWVDLDYNAGFCFGVPVSNLTLEDNGCLTPTPAGCPRTAKIDESGALGAGRCDAGPTDQRGLPRTPAGLGCDAGAFEADCNPNGPGAYPVVFDVSTEAEFTAAISCVNLEIGPLAVLIDLQNDIDAVNVTSRGVFASITQTRFVELTIEGNGHTLRRGTETSRTLAPVFSVAETSTASEILINDLEIQVGQFDSQGLDLGGANTFQINRSAIVAAEVDSRATGISSNAKTGYVVDSIIDGMRVGVRASGGEAFGILRTTISSSEVDLQNDGNSFFTALASTLTAPVGVQLGPGIHYLVYSTVLGDGAALSPTSTGSMRVLSSIVDSCEAPFSSPTNPVLPAVFNDGANVGRCFSFGPLIDTALADNGCSEPTPVGCPKTVALRPNSPASATGDCSEFEGGLLATDQRGEARTPVGPGCDAGAYELAPRPGDVDGDNVVTALDAQAVLEWLAGGLGPPYLELGDVTGDGQVKLDDALSIAQNPTPLLVAN